MFALHGKFLIRYLPIDFSCIANPWDFVCKVHDASTRELSWIVCEAGLTTDMNIVIL